ncbi:MAG: YraN family protein [Bacteroidia bacterium]|nr:YraN family protein [Bacteroidia bacterium]
MAESHDLGKIGEDLATEHLKKSGYRILKRNWKSGKNEIDIIAENKDYIVFAEVKTRTEDLLIPVGDIVNREKQKSIIFCADKYINWYNISKECRFDVIIIIMNGDSHRIDHIEDAFYPTLR